MPAHPARFHDLTTLPGPGPWTSADLLGLGWTPKGIRHARSTGALMSLARGVYGRPHGSMLADLRSLCAAALITAPAGAVISHATGARLQCITLPARVDDWIHVTSPGDAGRTHRSVRLHRSALPADLRATEHGLPVTTIARTAVDTARGHTAAQALVVLDSAARLLVAQSSDLWVLRDPTQRDHCISAARDKLTRAWDSVRTWPGTRVVADLLPHVDPCSESPFESTSRARMITSGFPSPLLAWPVSGASGRTYYADFVWLGARVVGEADGWSKYGDAVSVRDRLRQERERQRDLESAGWIVVRWDPSEPLDAVLRRILAALNHR